MLHKVTALLILVLLFGFTVTQAQNYSTKTLPNKFITGDEVIDMSNVTPERTYQIPQYGNVYAGSLTWSYRTITDIMSGYDMQSNASTHEIWVDLNTPEYIHTVFMNSQVANGVWADRTSLYLISTDKGASWNQLGGVPVNNGTTGRSGYCAIYGLSTGEAVIMNHNNSDGTPVRAKIFVDNSPFEYSFTTYDPGAILGQILESTWPRGAVNQNDDIVLAASQSTAGSNIGDSFYVNFLNRVPATYTGWEVWDGNQAESYTLGVSDGGKIGMAFIGQSHGSPLTYENEGDVFYTYSDDDGLNWSTPEKIFTRDHSNDTTWGAMRGITINFYGEDPCISFETAWQDFVAGTYRQGDANSLYFWSPNVNGGTPKVLVDTTWALWNPGGGANDVMEGVCRPVLSRSESQGYLFLVFNAATDTVDAGEDSPYFAGYFTYSTDGGDTWSDPEKFTPDTPLLDFRHPSIADVSPVSMTDDGVITIHITIVGDPEAGSTVNGVNKHVTSQYYYFTTDIAFVGVDDNIFVNNFNLEQNYPNPFNPNTTINYSLAEISAVTLKVYDVLGNEVATLVNTTQEAGKHNVTFDAAKLASGLYIYTLNTGNFTSSKKMMLLK
jgi:hypothetical protein